VTLKSLSTFLNGVPHGQLSQALAGSAATLGTWILNAAQNDISIAQSLQSGLTGAHHLNPDVIDDIFFVCHYSVSPIG
jgi:hypothetical protein